MHSSVDRASEQETVGQRLRRLRLARGMSQRALAGPGVSAAYISRIESGEREPSVKAIRLLAKRLGLSALYLETGQAVDEAADRELRLRDAELALRLGDKPGKVERQLRDLLAEMDAAGDVGGAARARTALGLAAFQRGDHPVAVEELERARESEQVDPLSAPDLFATLGRAYVSSGRTEKAVALFEAALAELERRAPDQSAAYVRFATYLSYALADMGELARAREVIEKTLARADEVTDLYARMRLSWAQARLAAADGDPSTALDYLHRAIALLEATEDRRHLGRAHLLTAEILTLEDRPDEALPHLETAETLLGPRPDAEDLYWLRAEQARQAASAGDADRATRLAREALELIGDSDPAERGTAYWALGEGLFGLGDAEGGGEALREAVALLAGERLWHEAAACCRTWARLLRATGKDEEAFAVLGTDLGGRRRGGATSPEAG